MTREEAKEKWEVIKAYGEGKTIQFYGASGKWFDLGEGFELPVEEKLRIKKVCNNCTNKKCYITSLPESERKDCNEHHENYDWGIVFDCRNHNKWQGE